MKFGAAIFPTDYAIDVRELARALEDSGFESLWIPEHTHIPVSRKTPWPGGRELPREYSHMLDPFVALAAAAAVTTTLRLATGICLVPERDPIVTAKAVASVDHVSGGRFLFGVGGGWNREEAENHGTDFDARWRLLRERIEAMKRIWAEDEAEYHGTMVDFDPIWSWPKPVQEPHPPILVGGNGEKAIDRVVAFGDEWMPNVGRSGLDELARMISQLQEKARDAGREQIPVSGFAAPRDPETVERLEEIGFSRLYWYVPPEPRDEVAKRLERYAGRVRELA